MAEHDTETCTLCSHAVEHSWWGMDPAHAQALLERRS